MTSASAPSGVSSHDTWLPERADWQTPMNRDAICESKTVSLVNHFFGPAAHRATVDIAFEHAIERSDRLFDLGRRYVLALPTEGIADAVDKIEIAVRVLAHEIAGAEPSVALLEHVAQDLGVSLRLRRI